MAIDKAISYRQQAAFGGIMGRDGRRMYGGGSDMGSVADSKGNVGPGTGGYQGGPQGGYGDAGSTNNPSGDRYRSSRREYQQAVNNAAAIEAARKEKEKRDKRDAKNKNITKFGYAKPKSNLSGILGTIVGMIMGIPGLGLLTGGFDKLGKGLGSLNETLGDFREKTTGFRTQKEYEDARTQRQLQGRLDNLYDRKAKGKNFSQKNIDMLESQYGLSPSTAQNVLTGRDLKGFTPSRMGLQKQITPMAKPTFSDPFRNTVGTTTKVNAPASDAVSSTVPQDLDEIGKGAGYVGYDKNELAAIAEGTKIPQLGDLTSFIEPLATITARERQLKNYFDSPIKPKESIMDGVPMINTGSVYQDNLDFFDNLNKGIVVNNEPPMVNTDNVMQGSVLDAKPKKGIMQMISDAIFSPAAAAEVRPAIGMENTPMGPMPTGDVGLNASGRLGNLSATVDAIDALKGESVNPQINYSGNFGNTNVFGNYSDDVQNLGLNFNNNKGLSGGISYDAITGEPRFDIGFRRTFADGGLASMFTRRG